MATAIAPIRSWGGLELMRRVRQDGVGVQLELTLRNGAPRQAYWYRVLCVRCGEYEEFHPVATTVTKCHWCRSREIAVKAAANGLTTIVSPQYAAPKVKLADWLVRGNRHKGGRKRKG